MRTPIRRPTPFHALAVLAVAALAACAAEPAGPGVEPSVAPWLAASDAPPVVLEWHAVARSQVAAGNMNALTASRLYAAVSVAQARAVAAVDADVGATGRGEAQGYGAGGRALHEARRGAVAGASVRVLGWFAESATDALERRLAEQGASGPGGVHPHFARGVVAGRAAGDAMVAHLESDGFSRTWSGSIPAGPGIWTPAALPPAGILLGEVTPYFLTSNDQFRPADPPPYLSPAFEADLAQVVAITTALTPAQRAIALGWAYGANTFTPPGYWDALAAEYIQAAGMDEAAATTVFAMMNAAVFDALIACFEAKYEFWTLRPHQADPAVARVFGVPNYPAYPSGHGSVSASAARVLAHYFPARAGELDAKVQEAAMSRVYAGLHYFFDMEAARTLGEQVADFAISRGLP